MEYWQRVKRRSSYIRSSISIHPSVREHALAIMVVAGVVVGIALGLLIKFTEDRWTAREVYYMKYVGDLFIGMLRGLILPLIISSLISAVGNMDLSLSSTIGGRAVAYYMLTTVVAVIQGIILVTSIRPGNRFTHPNNTADHNVIVRNVTITDTLMDLAR